MMIRPAVATGPRGEARHESFRPRKVTGQGKGAFDGRVAQEQDACLRGMASQVARYGPPDA
jgi:hypothetical protein